MRYTVRGQELIGDDATTVTIKVGGIVVAANPGASMSQVHDSGGPSMIAGWNKPSRGMLGGTKAGSTRVLLGLH